MTSSFLGIAGGRLVRPSNRRRQEEAIGRSYWVNPFEGIGNTFVQLLPVSTAGLIADEVALFRVSTTRVARKSSSRIEGW